MSKGRVIKGLAQELVIGPAKSAGKYLPYSKNLVNYIDCRGHFKLLQFFFDHHDGKFFQILWIIANREAHSSVTELVCKRFFGLYGQATSPGRSKLQVMSYEGIAMLAKIMSKVYVED